MHLPKNVEYILSAYRDAAYEAFVVGGPVRDALLLKTPTDYDITTSATPDETREVFRGHRIIETGLAHGTLTLLLDGEPYEVTTYRVDGEYADHRHPDTVTFTRSLKEDLARRDFTVNAMAYAPEFGLVDPFGGTEDLSHRILRAVGDPYRRFDEDALRILRGLRFCSVLSFDIEEKTARAMRELAHLLPSVSVERVLVELDKLLMGARAREVLLEYRDVLAFAIPELSFSALPELTPLVDAPSRLLLLSIASGLCGAQYRALCDRLHTDRARRQLGEDVYRVLSLPYATDADLLMLAHEGGREAACLSLTLRSLLGEPTERARERLRKLLLDGAPTELSQLALRGADLALRGLRGSEIGLTLRSLLFAVMRGECENTRDALLSYLDHLDQKGE